jgi:hypothetical protein
MTEHIAALKSIEFPGADRIHYKLRSTALRMMDWTACDVLISFCQLSPIILKETQPQNPSKLYQLVDRLNLLTYLLHGAESFLRS